MAGRWLAEQAYHQCAALCLKEGLTLTTNCLGGLPLRASRFLAASSHCAMIRSRLQAHKQQISAGQPTAGSLRYHKQEWRALLLNSSAHLYLRGRTSLPSILPGNIRIPNASCMTTQLSVVSLQVWGCLTNPSHLC